MTPIRPVFFFERVETGPVEIGKANLWTVGVFQAKTDTTLSGVYGSFAHAFLEGSTTGQSVGQVLVQFHVSQNDPGPGPFNGWMDAFPAMGQRAPLWAHNAKLLCGKNAVTSDSQIFSHQFFPEILVPQGYYLQGVCGVTHNAARDPKAPSQPADYGKYNWEFQLMFGVDAEMQRVVRP